MDFSNSFSQIKDSVVNILALDDGNQVVSSGSGVLIDDGSLALTCSHCIIPNTKIVARFSGQTNGITGTTFFNDPVNDIAMIQFKNSIGPSVSMKSSSTVMIGQEAFIVGFPMGIDKITSLSANIAGFENVNSFNFIRIDSSVNHGNSGGPLFNSDGELIGIVNAKHGSLSNFLNQIATANPGTMMSIGGINPVQAIQQLIKEMKKNLNLGIGYAIPSDYIGSLNDKVSDLIKP